MCRTCGPKLEWKKCKNTMEIRLFLCSVSSFIKNKSCAVNTMSAYYNSLDKYSECKDESSHGDVARWFVDLFWIIALLPYLELNSQLTLTNLNIELQWQMMCVSIYKHLFARVLSFNWTPLLQLPQEFLMYLMNWSSAVVRNSVKAEVLEHSELCLKKIPQPSQEGAPQQTNALLSNALQ